MRRAPQRQRCIKLLIQSTLFEKWQDHQAPAKARRTVAVVVRKRHSKGRSRRCGASQICRRKHIVRVVIIVESLTQLLQMIATLRPTCGFSSLLHGGQQQRNQNRDNGNNDEQFNQGERATASRSLGRSCMQSAMDPHGQSPCRRCGHGIEIYTPRLFEIYRGTEM